MTKSISQSVELHIVICISVVTADYITFLTRTFVLLGGTWSWNTLDEVQQDQARTLRLNCYAGVYPLPTPFILPLGSLFDIWLYNGCPCICGCQGRFYHGNGSILTLWLWLNDEKQLFWCKFIYANNHLYLVINFNHVKLRYIEPCNFLTKRALMSQQSTLAVAKDPKISYYLNLLKYLPTSILAII